MHNFTYHRAIGLLEAQNLLGKLDDAKLIVGGQSLLPMMKLRLAAPANLIDLGKVEGLSGIELGGQALVIGAMTTHAEVNVSPVVKEALPALTELAGMIGDPAVRHRGTLGGSLAHDDPTADYPAACLALGATIITTKRRIPADEFFTGLFETALAHDEIITKVSFPLAKTAAYQKFRNPASRYAIVGVFVAERPSEVRVAVTGVTGGAFPRKVGGENRTVTAGRRPWWPRMAGLQALSTRAFGPRLRRLTALTALATRPLIATKRPTARCGQSVCKCHAEKFRSAIFARILTAVHNRRRDVRRLPRT
jgi:carbon-monoxide dehydrogenase medium subunit